MGKLLAEMLTALTILWLCSIAATEPTLTIESVVAPGGTTYTPTVAANKQYDIPAGSNVSLKCEIAGASATIRYQTNKWAKFSRFDTGSRVSQDNSSMWILSDLHYYDTGAIECYHSSSEGNKSSIYLFVYDANAPLYVPLKEQFFYYYILGSYFPCLPTHSQTELGMNYLDYVLTSRYIIVDVTAGVAIGTTEAVTGEYKCTFKYGDRNERFNASLVIMDIRSLPTPILSSDKDKHHYIAGERLLMQCQVDYAYMERLKWTYPALNCSNSNCQAPDRVDETDKIRKSYESYVSALEVSDLELKDAGNYTCSYKVFEDPEYRVQTTTEITVYERQFCRCDTNNQTMVGTEGDSNIQLIVNLYAVPRPPTMWTFQSQPLDRNHTGKYTTSFHKTSETTYIASLQISSLSKLDRGSYSLTSADSARVAFSCDINLDINVVPVTNLFYTYSNHRVLLSKTKTVYVKPAKVLILECATVEGFPRPNISFSWQLCDIPASSNWTAVPLSLVNPSVTTANQPYLSAVSPTSQQLQVITQTSAYYRCESENVAGTTMQSIHMVVSELAESSRGVGFTERTLSRAADLVEDDSLLLQCYVARFECVDTDVQIVATVGGQNSVYTKNSQQINWTEGDNSYKVEIRLTDIKLSMDGDTYVCRCDKVRQGPSLVLSVQVYVTPRWAQTVTTDVMIAPGDTHTFMCKPEGRPLPEVTWYKDGLTLHPSNTVLLSPDMYNLTIVKAGIEDSGQYKCVGETTRARDSIESSFYLSVQELGVKFSTRHILILVFSVLTLIAVAAVGGASVVRRHCRKKYIPHELLLPSKETLNPNIPIDEQTDALPYDISWEFPIGNLKLGMLLGQGAFGRVLKAEAKNIDEVVGITTVAVKTVRDQHDVHQVKALISELKILIHIGKHLNIVNLLGACTKNLSRGHLLVIVEYCRYGNLRAFLLQNHSDLDTMQKLCNSFTAYTGQSPHQVSEHLIEDPSELHSQDKPVSMRDIMSWCYQIARGMEYLASIDYIHRDLAARNVLLAEDNIVKICDFGLSKDIYKYKEYKKQCEGPLPIKWMALESLTHKVFNVRTDVWAYGVTVWELFSLAATPYPGWEIDDTFIDKLQDGYRMERPQLCPPEIYEEIMARCWDADPDNRPNFTEVGDKLVNSLERSVVERLNSLERKYVNSSAIDGNQSSSLSTLHGDDVFVETCYLTPQVTNTAKAKYYNMVESGQRLKADDELEMPLEVAPPIPSDSTIACSTSSSSAGSSSRNTRPPSYSFVMDNQNRISDSTSVHVDAVELHSFSSESIDV